MHAEQGGETTADHDKHPPQPWTGEETEFYGAGHLLLIQSQIPKQALGRGGQRGGPAEAVQKGKQLGQREGQY